MGVADPTDPIYHGARDLLDEDHLMARESQYCVTCQEMVHAFNNETMQDWFETAEGPMCFDCFAVRSDRMDIPGPSLTSG